MYKFYPKINFVISFSGCHKVNIYYISWSVFISDCKILYLSTQKMLYNLENVDENIFVNKKNLEDLKFLVKYCVHL